MMNFSIYELIVMWSIASLAIGILVGSAIKAGSR